MLICIMPTYEDYAFAQRHYQETEMQKKPGQDFCDKFGWRLHSDFDEIQRPDKITYMNGSVYRTHTPTTHVWYQSKKNPSYHVWIEFSGALIFVKMGIRVIKNRVAVGTQPYLNQNRLISEIIKLLVMVFVRLNIFLEKICKGNKLI